MDINNFPPPFIPLSPILDDGYWAKPHQHKTPSIFDAQYKLNTTSGRAALSIALELCQVTSAHNVLVPSYHCESMVSPALRLTSSVFFYKVNKDTSPDIKDISEKINKQTKAILVTHFFGFTQDLSDIKQLCDKHNIFLIEDCAHAFFGETTSKPVGTVGDYAIASTMKFFPVLDGGILASDKHDVSTITLNKPTLPFQLKSAINSFEKAISFKRLGKRGAFLNLLFTVKNNLWNSIKRSVSGSEKLTSVPGSSEGGFGLDENWINVHSTYFSKQIITRANYSSICSKRQHNYKVLHNALKDLPGCEPLFESSPDGVTPLVYPLKFDNPDLHFSALKEKGVPIWRFGEYLDEQITPEEFPISCELSKTIFQFPCHQSLTQDELDWMITTIKETIKS